MKLILCRHGETAWSQSGQHTSATDIPLTPTGQCQATQMAAALKILSPLKTFSSPRLRAIQTAKLAGLQASPDPDLTEWDYGDFEGMTSAQIAEKHPNWNLFTDGAPNGESVEQVSKRADHILQKLQNQPGPIALFSHGHFSRVLAARWLGLPASSGALFFLSVASISILGHERTHPVLKLWNATAHLT